MKIVISSSKGGVGKSVSSIFVAELSSRMGKNTLLVDAGYQATTSNYFLNNDYELRKEKNLFNVLIGNIKPKDSIIKIKENLSLIPGFIDLTDFSDHVKIKDKDLIIKAVFSKVFNDYDNVIFDTESSLGSLTRNVYHVAEIAVIPIYDSKSIDEARKTIDNIIALNSNIKKTYILPVMKRMLSRSFSKILAQAKEKLDDIDFLQPIMYYKDIFEGDMEKAVSGKAIANYEKSVGGLL